ncbi:MAG: trigger factor [Anaerolineae bacterium CG2_30_58_95]|nr:MAG: trigger factor [Anaerolineae bacterium CG2_30_58_95]
MKIETQPRDDHQVTMTVKIEAERLEGARHRAARKISERAKIPGFRPGKAPYEVVLRHYGDAAITEDAVELLVAEIYPEALKKAKIEPAAPGKLEKVESLKPPRFIFTVPLEPTVDLGGYRAIRLPYEWQAPGEDKVDEEIDGLRHIYSTMDSVERPVQEGDFVMLDVLGVKAKAEEGETPVIDRPGYPVFVRPEEKEDEWPFAGFSHKLLGLEIGQSKSFTHKFDQECKEENLRGQTVKFIVTIKAVRGVKLPELNDEFAKKVGSFESLSALRDVVRANLEGRSKADYEDGYYLKLIDEIKKGATVKYPPQVLDHEIEHVTEDFVARLAGQNLELDAYLKMREMDKEKFIAEEIKPAAINRLERSLIMDKVALTEKIKVSQEMLSAAIQQTVGGLQGSEDYRKAMRGKSTPPKQMQEAITLEAAGRAITQQTLARLKDIALGLAPELPVEEVKEKPKVVAHSATKVVAHSATKKQPAKKKATTAAAKAAGTKTSEEKASKGEAKPRRKPAAKKPVEPEPEA